MIQVEYEARYRLIEKFRLNQNFSDSQVPFVPNSLLEKATKKAKIKSHHRVGVFNTVEWALYLSHIGVKDITILVKKDCAITRKCCELWGFDYIIYSKELTMKKFDVIVGNPPFSKSNSKSNVARATPLFPIFFDDATNIAETVAMIMPETSTKDFHFKKHNKNLKTKCYDIEHVSPEHQKEMGVETKMWVVFADQSKEPNVENYFKIKKVNSMKIVKGRLNVGNNYSKIDAVGLTPVVRAVGKTGAKIVYTSMKKESALVKSNFVLVFGLRLNESFDLDILNSKQGLYLGTNTYYIECKTIKEAKQYKQIFENENFVKQALTLRGNSNTITLQALASINVEDILC